ncbi:MAG: GntR family transcriptional regulator, partial [Chloroflexi bacterium]
MSKTRAGQIADRLRQAIMTGTFVSGDRLTELTLAHNLNVSQNTIRDSLHILEAEGWVTKIPRRGVFVRSFTADEVEELCALRAAVELLILQWALQKLTRTHVNQLRTLIRKAEQQLAHEGDATLTTLFDFHRQLATVAERPYTQRVLTRLHNQIYLLEILRQMRTPLNMPMLHDRVRHYRALLASIEAGESDEAQ